MCALWTSFKYAAQGVIFCIKNERNMRIHMVITLYLIIFSRFFTLTGTQYVLLIMTVAFVMSMEMLNTSIETVVDFLSPGYDRFAKISKDVAAGAVFLSSIAAVAIGIVIFWDIPSFQKIYLYYIEHVVSLIFLILSLIPAIAFIFGPWDRLKRLIKGKTRE